MGQTFSEISPDTAAWIDRQHLFFVASSPMAADGHINLSPKGGDSFRVLGPNDVAYLDLTGSGVETIAHLRENGRIVVMFCAFEGSPRIVRLHGRGTVVQRGEPDFNGLASAFPDHPGARAVIRIAVARVSDSCGYAVPLMDYREERTVLDKWSERKGVEGMEEYRRQINTASIDGLPAYEAR